MNLSEFNQIQKAIDTAKNEIGEEDRSLEKARKEYLLGLSYATNIDVNLLTNQLNNHEQKDIMN